MLWLWRMYAASWVGESCSLNGRSVLSRVPGFLDYVSMSALMRIRRACCVSLLYACGPITQTLRTDRDLAGPQVPWLGRPP